MVVGLGEDTTGARRAGRTGGWCTGAIPIQDNRDGAGTAGYRRKQSTLRQLGTTLRRPDGTTVTVTAVHNFHQHKTTYDLTVGTLHTYYVLAGATPILVHNCPTDAVTLYRFGSGPETTEKLAQDAANAEAHDFPHGISTSTRLPPKFKESGEFRSTTVGEFRERGFQVEQTGNNRAHHTVHLPKPVTDEVTQSLNEAFGSG